MKSNVMKEDLVKDKENNNESSMNYQNEDGNEKNCASIKDKWDKSPSEATRKTQRRRKISPKKYELRYQFQGPSVIVQHWFNIDTNCIEDNFMTRETEFFKFYT